MSHNQALAVLDRQVAAIRWLQSTPARDFLTRTWRMESKVYKIGDGVQTVAWAQRLGETINRAATYWVAPDMVTLIESARETLPHDPLREWELPSKDGWVEWGRPIAAPEPGTRTRAASWGTVSNIVMDEDRPDVLARGIEMTFWREPGDYREEAIRAGQTKVEADRLVESLRAVARPVGMIPEWSAAWAFDLPWRSPILAADSETRYTPLGRVTMRALWLLLGQELPAVRRLRPPRHQTRRVGRFLAHVPEIVVVDLRRTQPHVEDTRDPDAPAVLWSHRWTVSGHWRRIRGADGQQRTVWVRPYVKGPEGKPLIVEDRVFRLVR